MNESLKKGLSSERKWKRIDLRYSYKTQVLDAGIKLVERWAGTGLENIHLDRQVQPSIGRSRKGTKITCRSFKEIFFWALVHSGEGIVFEFGFAQFIRIGSWRAFACAKSRTRTDTR